MASWLYHNVTYMIPLYLFLQFFENFWFCLKKIIQNLGGQEFFGSDYLMKLTLYGQAKHI